MKRDLQDAFERLKWCDKEIETIGNVLSVFWNSKPYNLKSIPLFAETGGAFLIILTDIKSLPIDIRQRVGTTVNELRSILDSLACTLAIRNGEENLAGVSFPVANSQTSFINDTGIRRKIRKISNSDKKLIATLEPWQGGNDLLHALHGADISRKHKYGVKLSAIAEGVSINNSKSLYIRSIPECEFKEGAVLAKIGYAKSVKFDLMGIVPTYSEPPFLVGKNAITVLNDFSSFVQKALELFS